MPCDGPGWILFQVRHQAILACPIYGSDDVRTIGKGRPVSRYCGRAKEDDATNKQMESVPHLLKLRRFCPLAQRSLSPILCAVTARQVISKESSSGLLQTAQR